MASQPVMHHVPERTVAEPPIAGTGSMRICIFAQHYPIPYKPYYDAQFADLLKAGHDVTIFAAGRYESTNEKVRRYGLAARTRYFTTTAETVVERLPQIAGQILGHPLTSLRAAAVASRSAAGARKRLAHALRAVSVTGSAPDLCFIHGLGTAVLLPWLRDRFPGTPVAMYYHGGEVPTVRELPADRVRETFAQMDVVFTNTRFSRDHAVDRGCPPDRIEILPVGFDLDDYVPPRDRRYRPNGQLRLLSAGRMSEEKGFHVALEAIRILVGRGLRHIRYALTGEGYLRERLERYVAEYELEPYVEFLGRISTEDVIRAMGTADALLLPSLQVGNWVENQAAAVQEAMLMKALVITSRTGGVPESVPPAMQRFVVPPGDADALADAIADLDRLPVSELERLGNTGREFVTARYDVGILNRQMLSRVTRP